jgi:CRISPR-associated protein Csd2
MPSLQHKIDFAVIFRVTNANPNGDPLNGNRPRMDYDGYGEVSDVCIKRKIRDRLQELGVPIFVQSDDRRIDEHKSLKARAEAILGKDLGGPETVKKACGHWFDVRAFGQIFAYKATGKKAKGKDKKDAGVAEIEKASETDSSGISIPIRGPVSVQTAISIEPVNVDSMQITKSVSGEGDGSKRGSDTMGMKHRVKRPSVYVFYGAMNPQLAERTQFSDDDAVKIRDVLPKLFENDASSARPEGTMQVLKVFWWQHNCKAGQYSSAKVHQTLTANADGTHELRDLEGLKPVEIDGF